MLALIHISVTGLCTETVDNPLPVFSGRTTTWQNNNLAEQDKILLAEWKIS
ncbi:hypothetical protein ECP030229310_4718 [Escherichia coli P0302293.10]|nr:hypothetical protein ECP030229310_4718 [Escherichia coli P0302293.10]